LPTPCCPETSMACGSRSELNHAPICALARSCPVILSKDKEAGLRALHETHLGPAIKEVGFVDLNSQPHLLSNSRYVDRIHSGDEGRLPSRQVQEDFVAHGLHDLNLGFDLDSLDPIYAPGVSNIEPGYPGLTMWEAMRCLHGMRGMNIIGGDVVCPMPTKDDPSKITSINASVIMFEIICLVADWLHNHKD